MVILAQNLPLGSWQMYLFSLKSIIHQSGNYICKQDWLCRLKASKLSNWFKVYIKIKKHFTKVKDEHSSTDYSIRACPHMCPLALPTVCFSFGDSQMGVRNTWLVHIEKHLPVLGMMVFNKVCNNRNWPQKISKGKDRNRCLKGKIKMFLNQTQHKKLKALLCLLGFTKRIGNAEARIGSLLSS